MCLLYAKGEEHICPSCGHFEVCRAKIAENCVGCTHFAPKQNNTADNAPETPVRAVKVNS